MFPADPKAGGVNAPPVAAWSWARVCPPLNPVSRAAFEAAAVLKTLPGAPAKPPAATWPGARLPTIVNWKGFTRGMLLDSVSAICPGNVSMNRPMPPRRTVFFRPSGDHEKPNRGCQAMFVNFGRARLRPVVTAWLYGTLTL